MKIPAKITMAKPLLHEQSEKINEIIDAITPIINAIGAGSVNISKSGANWIISMKSEPTSDPMPVGEAGDMLYHDGNGWVVLLAPTVSVSNPVLRHDGTAPYWEEPEDC